MSRIGERSQFNDDVLYLGVNHAVVDGQVQCDREARQLRFIAPNLVRVMSATDDATVGTFDLAKDSDLLPFAKSLGVPQEQAEKIAAVLEGARTQGRDELAGLAMVWARAERELGEVPSRIVLSGHCAGAGIYDGADSSNDVDFDDVRALAKAMPKAAAHVEDIMISACHSGSEDELEAWHDAFPNLRSAWGYGSDQSKSPTSSVAVAHMAAWERATRGRDVPHAQPAILHGSNVTYWTAADGHHVPTTRRSL